MRPEKSSVTELAIPSRGFSTRYPLAKMPPEFCAWMCDYEIGAGYLESRKGLEALYSASTNYVTGIAAHPSDPDLIVDIDTYNASYIELSTYNPITDTRSAAILTLARTSPGPRARALGFADRVFWFFEGEQPAVYDGTTLANAAFTGPTGANDQVVFGASFKGHLWVFEHRKKFGWYHPTVNGIAGALTLFDLSGITNDNGAIMCAFGITLSSGLQSQALFCFVFDTGEIVAYSGDSPSGTWALVGRSQIGSPLGYQSIIEADGDVFVMTKGQVVSVRTLFTVASGNLIQSSITNEIERYWQTLVEDISLADAPTGYDPRDAIISLTNGAFHQRINRLAIFIPRYLMPKAITSGELGFEIDNVDKRSSVLIYDLSSRAWYVQKMPLFGSAYESVISSYYSPKFDALIVGTNDTANETAYKLWARDDYRDAITSVSFEAIEPELRTSIVKARQNFNCGGVLLTHSGEAAVKGAVDVNLITEFGRTASSACSVATSSGVSEEFYNVGGESKSFQAVVTVPIPSDGTVTKPHQIVDISLMLEPGGTLG